MPGGSIPGQGSFNAVTCPSIGQCVAVGADSGGNAVVATSANAGQSWNNQSIPAIGSPLEAVSCADETHCVAVGQGTIVYSSDGGSTWTQSAPPVANVTLLSIPALAALIV